MEFLGIGPLELILILVIALIVLGPNDMVKAGRTIGRFLRKLVMSETWQAMGKMRYLPNQLMREAGLDEVNEQLKKEMRDVKTEMNVEIGTTNIGSPDLSDWLNPQPNIINPPQPPALPSNLNETQNEIAEGVETTPPPETDQK